MAINVVFAALAVILLSVAGVTATTPAPTHHHGLPTRKAAWFYPQGASATLAQPLAVNDNMVYFAEGNNLVKAVSLTNGTLVWSNSNFTLASFLDFAPYCTNEVCIFVDSNSGIVFALNADNGILRWCVSAGYFLAQPYISQYNNVIVQVIGTTMAYDLNTGKQLWSTPVAPYLPFSNFPGIIGWNSRHFYFISNISGTMMAVELNMKDGSLLWTAALPIEDNFPAYTLVPGDIRVIFDDNTGIIVITLQAGSDFWIMALTIAENGRWLWKFKQSGVTQLATLTVAEANGLIMYTTLDGSNATHCHVIARNLTTGAVAWSSGPYKFSPGGNYSSSFVQPSSHGTTTIFSESDRVVAVSAATGVAKWVSEPGAFQARGYGGFQGFIKNKKHSLFLAALNKTSTGALGIAAFRA